MKRWRDIFRSFALVLISTMFALFLCEGILRLFLPQQLILIRPDMWCPDGNLGWKHCPNVDTVINSGEGDVAFHTDSAGFRINPLHMDTSPEVKILALGDSFLEGIQVNDHETVSERIAEFLRARHGKTVSVINTGVGEWNPNQYLIQAKLELPRDEYDLGLVFLYVANDVVSEVKAKYEPRQSIVGNELRFPSNLTQQEIIDAVLYPINDFLEMRSHLFILFKKRCATLLMKWGLTGYSLSPVFFKEETDSDRWKVTGLICKHIADAFKEHDTPVVFVFIPADYQVDETSFDRHLRGFDIPAEIVDLDQPNRILKEEIGSYGLDIVDPLEYMRSAYKAGQVLYGTIDNHLNAAGHKILAELVLPTVEERLFPLSQGNLTGALGETVVGISQ